MSKLQDTETPLCPNERYHIFNRGNRGQTIFYRQRNYAYFLQKFAKYMNGYVHTSAYALLPNHFHFAVRVKSRAELTESAAEDFKSVRKSFLTPYLPTARFYEQHLPVKFDFLMSLSEENYHLFFQRFDCNSLKERLLEWVVSERLRILMMSFAKSINKQENLSGSLFQKNFKRKVIPEDAYWENLILYIHRNPVHHGCALNTEDWIWTSFPSLLSDKPTRLCREEVLALFNGREQFLHVHHRHVIDWKKKEKWVLE